MKGINKKEAKLLREKHSMQGRYCSSCCTLGSWIYVNGWTRVANPVPYPCEVITLLDRGVK